MFDLLNISLQPTVKQKFKQTYWMIVESLHTKLERKVWIYKICHIHTYCHVFLQIVDVSKMKVRHNPSRHMMSFDVDVITLHCMDASV